MSEEKDYSDADLVWVLGTISSSEDSIFNNDFEEFHEAQKYNSHLEMVCCLEDTFD